MPDPLPTGATVICTINRFRVNARRIAAIVDVISECCGVANCVVNVSIVGSRKIQSLNNQFRGKNKSTDVLSFPLENWVKPVTVHPHRVAKRSRLDARCQVTTRHPRLAMPRYLGDIVISAENAEANARQIGQGLDREVCFLLVHGFLHLCGHDHIQPDEERVMLKAQRLIMRSIEVQRKLPMWRGCITKSTPSHSPMNAKTRRIAK